MRGIWLLTVSIAIAAALTTAQTTGRISGNVISEDGAVVDHFDVCMSVTSGNNTTTNCRVATDAQGHFEIEDVKFGSYGIFAVKEQEGYSIDNQTPGLKVTVTADSPWQSVTIRLRERGAILTGSVTDRVSGRAVEDAWINYIDIDNGGISRRGGDTNRWNGDRDGQVHQS